jgi:methylenetetrahydrofolate--tRNA-(uracil-5-)-methyltransferase
MDIAFRASRYGKGDQEEGDYINCPFTKDEYYLFVNALQNAERIELRSFEEATLTSAGVKAGAFFEGCLPIEIIAERGIDSLAFGSYAPVGLRNLHR